MKNKPYCEAVGTLMYASLGMHLDITYAVGILSKFNKKPGLVHWNMLKHVYAYLAGTWHLKLTFRAHQANLMGYADVDGSMHKDRKAISGYAYLIDGAAMFWSSKQQEIIVLLTTKVEYVATTHATKEALWLRLLINEIFKKFSGPITLFGNNQLAIVLTKDHQYHAHMKHINIRFHFICWIVKEGKIKLVYCPTNEMVVDMLTKALPSTKVKYFTCTLRLSKD